MQKARGSFNFIFAMILRIAVSTTGILLLLVLTFVLFGIPPGKALAGLWIGAFGSAEDGHWYAISETFVKTTPLLLTGLGIGVAWRTGMFNIGGEGQLLMGALGATAFWQALPWLPTSLLTLGMLLAGTLSGALWGGLAAWLRIKRNVQEVISTIMLNYIALYFVGALVNGPLQESNHRSPHSNSIPDSILFARLIPPTLSGGIQARLHLGVLIAFLVVPALYTFLFFTPTGFGLRLVGQNPEAARTARFSVDVVRMRAMLLSGGLCGLAGVIELLGISAQLDANFSSGWGYTAIPVALLGGLHPIGIMFSALFFGGLTAGCGYLSRFFGVSSDIINVIQAAAVLAVLAIRVWQSGRTGNVSE